MKVSRIEDYKQGWFAGNFEPTAFRSTDFEVGYRTHKKGEVCDTHYHKVGTEINLLVKGSMTLQGVTLKSGDVFIIYPFEITDPIFHEDCSIVVVKTPSLPGDKYPIKSK